MSDSPLQAASVYKKKALAARRKVLEMIWKAKTSHIASNFSVIDIATVLYENLKEGDEVVWSKGWAAATIYYFLAQQGKIPVEDLEKFPNAPYLGLAETTVPGVLCSGGSVGHGASIAMGIALGKKRAKLPGIVYCIMSDGEFNEGSTWEAVMLAAHHNLTNLAFIVDSNGWQAMDRTKDICKLDIQRAIWGFNWVSGHVKGHDYNALTASIGGCGVVGPTALICNTIKGKGVSFMEDKLEYHYKHVSDEDYEKALKELV